MIRPQAPGAVALVLVINALCPRIARSQPVPVDAGVPDAAPTEPEVTPPPIPPLPPTPPPPAPGTEEPPRIAHQTPPLYPDLPPAKQKVVDVSVHVEVDAAGNPDRHPRRVRREPAVRRSRGRRGHDVDVRGPRTPLGKPVASHLTVTAHFDPKATGGGETITIKDKLTAIQRGHLTAPVLGAVDVRTEAKHLAEVPHKEGAIGMLAWAPGFLLTNEGGEGHAEQIFLRGFDAREGQDIEMRVNGDVVNQVGNLHGNGYADMHFIIPELVQAVRVIEGPYDHPAGQLRGRGQRRLRARARRGARTHRELPRSARSARGARCCSGARRTRTRTTSAAPSSTRPTASARTATRGAPRRSASSSARSATTACSA